MTYHRAVNYGAILQAYALQRVIQRKGIDCDIIDYHCENIENQYKYKPLSSQNIITTIKYNINQYLHKEKKRNFELFRKYKLKLSLPYNKENIRDINDLYDCFITGSDQVWNCQVNGNDHTYFLDFVIDPKKKNSYAASFGVSKINQPQATIFKELLGSFNNISVREKAGQQIVKDILGFDCDVVLDPVLLLTQDEWLELSEGQFDSNYVLVYQLYKSKSLIEFARALAKKSNCKLIIISQSLYGAFYGVPGIDNKSNVGPETFLSLIRGARYVVTNSFHGTAFSIIFHKEFFTEYVSDKFDVNSRFYNLLDMLGLLGRRIDSSLHLIPAAINDIDYDTVDRRLKVERDASISYLMGILG